MSTDDYCTCGHLYGEHGWDGCATACGCTDTTTPQTRLPLAGVLATWKDGDERGWAAEFEFLRREDADRIDQLASSVQQDGIREPILLGHDGRVWDGHHRLCVADMLGLPEVPVEYARTTPTPQARPSEQDVERVLAEGYLTHGDLGYASPAIREWVWRCRCGAQVGDGAMRPHQARRAHAAHVAAEQAAALRAMPTGDEALAKAWDEGFMAAASQDHPAYPRTRLIENPYLTTPPAQDPSKETDR